MTEMGAVALIEETIDEEVIDEETVLRGDPLNDAIVIEPDVMVDSRRGATTSRGTIRGRLHVG